MKNLLLQASLVLAIIVVGTSPALSQNIQNEISGQDDSRPFVFNEHRAMDGIPAGGLLLIPESTNDRVMAFDPQTGNLLDANFIASDPDNLSTPKEIILNHDNTGLLLVDQLEDAVYKYDMDGNFIGLFAPAGGVNTTIVDNPRGICLRPNGNLLLTLGATANEGACIEFDTDGNYLGVFLPATGTSTFDVIHTWAGGYMTSEIDQDALYSYDASGSYTGTFASINYFPEQLFQCRSGNILVGNFVGTEAGVVEYDPSGTKIGQYTPNGLGGFRGVYELPNGNILTSTSSGVYEIDRSGNLVDTKISGVSSRFISLVKINDESQIPFSPWLIPMIIIGIVAISIFRLRRVYGA